jgi:hypothetical protein
VCNVSFRWGQVIGKFIAKLAEQEMDTVANADNATLTQNRTRSSRQKFELRLLYHAIPAVVP